MLGVLIINNMILKILFLFMAYSILGWFWETPYVSFSEKKYINRGFLRGPYIPIYGFACLTIILSMSIFRNLDDSIFLIIIQIIFISLVSVIWEYFTSLGLEIAFKTRWWDYSDHKFNLQGRVALDYTILFGIGGYLLWRFINPIIDGLYYNIIPSHLIIVIMMFYVVFLIDNIYTFRDLLRLRELIIKLNNLKTSFAGKYDYIFEKAYDSIMERDEGFVKSLGDYKNSLRRELSSIRNKGGNKLALSIENKASQLNTILLKSKSISRLFEKYPKSPSKSYSYLLKVLKNKKS
ncbi:MAG: hypothetical protein KQ78_01179 [Candidatus Izimaplasma bacterium HR2]|nr:MAG: hypothetical protein KQ78_01179 [Candidatus Izimaplasma bacterium HR2]